MGMCLVNIRVVGLNTAVIPSLTVHLPILSTFGSSPFHTSDPPAWPLFQHLTFIMAGLLDILLALVKVLCGSRSTTQEEPPTEYKKSDVVRPPHQQHATSRPEHPRIAPEHYRQVSVVPYMTRRRHTRDSTLDLPIHRSKNRSRCYLTLIQTIDFVRYGSYRPLLTFQCVICLTRTSTKSISMMNIIWPFAPKRPNMVT